MKIRTGKLFLITLSALLCVPSSIVFGQITQNAAIRSTHLKVDLYIEDRRTGNILSDGSVINVAKQAKFKVGVNVNSQTTLSNITYQWEINGSRIPTRDVAIKTYSYSVIGPVVATDLVASDLQSEEISLYYTDENSSSTLKVVVNSDSGTYESEVRLDVKHVSDPNREIYANLNPVPEDNPDGSGGVVDINTIHGNWHRFGGDNGMFTSNYNGQAFLDWHRVVIDAHIDWRRLFNVSSEFSKATYEPKPSYLTSTGGIIRSSIHGYVRLGECANVDEAGEIGVGWHNTGHSNRGGDMNSSYRAIQATGNQFWKWHQTVDDLRTFTPDQAMLLSTIPADNAILSTAPTTIAIEFDLPVSWNSNASTVRNFSSNNVQVTADALTVNGQPATSVTTSDFKNFIFTLPSLNAGSTVNVSLTGTRSFESKNWSFEIQ